tara:strand:+ start:668 stop:1369 length:702 start_codon:yes stop_codon:yes gene_type:complete
LLEFSTNDFLGSVFFIFGWITYTLYADVIGSRRGNLIGIMKQHRLNWMSAMLNRENRLVDIQIVSSLYRNSAFFASSSLLIVAGLSTSLGATEKAIDFLTDLPLIIQNSRQMWELKVIFLILIFIYSFFKFAWSMRQLNYCSILIGSSNKYDNLNDNDFKIAEHASIIATKSALHSNRGTRAYYFGIAFLVWFLHPLLLIPITIFVVMVLYRREFRSDILKSMTKSLEHNYNS